MLKNVIFVTILDTYFSCEILRNTEIHKREKRFKILKPNKPFCGITRIEWFEINMKQYQVHEFNVSASHIIVTENEKTKYQKKKTLFKC